MAVAIVVLLIGVLSVVFHNLNPWWFTPLASNWKQMDDTIVLTLWITGAVFLAIVVFMVYVLFRYRHKEGSKAHYEPENKKLEWWLLGLTTVGIIAMLVPGLLVWAKFVEAPGDAMTFEAVGQQWQWSFRFPGKNGMLGRVDPQRISADNPFGLSVDDPRAEDDYLIQGGEVHIPVNRPIQIVLRSKDVLHDFYVPHFRVKMDIVPGMVTKLWFTPTRTGKFEIACAEYCGMGHHTMRGIVYVEEQAAFDAWLVGQKTFAESMKPAGGTGDPLADKGREVAQEQGCVSCHSVDGANGAGPTWKGLYGKTETLDNGASAKVDEAYLKESIANPNAKIVKGFSAVMPPYKLSDEDFKALMHYLQNLDKAAPAAGGAASGQDAAAGGDKGKQLAQAQGCLACHSVDGSAMVGPTWKGLFSKAEELADGGKVAVDEAYFKESVVEPNAKIVKGFSAMMPPYKLGDEDLAALVNYVKSLGGSAAPETSAPAPAATPESAPPAKEPEAKSAPAPAAEPATEAAPAPESKASAATESAKEAPPAAQPAQAEPAKPHEAQPHKAAASGNGQQIAENWGCLDCHSTDGSAKGGPSFKGLFGKNQTLADGSTVTVDEAYFKDSILKANAKITQGFEALMPSYNMSAEEIDALINYAKGLK